MDYVEMTSRDVLELSASVLCITAAFYLFLQSLKLIGWL